MTGALHFIGGVVLGLLAGYWLAHARMRTDLSNETEEDRDARQR